jgi:RND family efflux transporter MFP subunit
LQRTRIRAPYDGRLIETFVNIGSVVSTSTRLADLYSTESLELSLPISNRDLEFLDLPTQGDQREVAVKVENTLVAPPEYWRATITGTEALVDADNQQIYALAQIEGAVEIGAFQQDLKVGQYLHASIEGKVIEEALLVPNTAIYQGSYVYVVEDRDGIEVLSKRDVSIRWRNEEFSLVGAGLQVGDKLVTTTLGQVTSGTPVQIKMQDASQSAGQETQS